MCAAEMEQYCLPAFPVTYNTSCKRQNQTYKYYFIMHMISPSLRRFEESRTNASYVIRHCTVRHFARCIVPIYVRVIVCVCECVRDILCYKLFPVGVKITTVAFGSIQQHLSVSVSIRAAASSLSVSILFFYHNSSIFYEIICKYC